jgi:hypothetical protein
MTAPVKMASTQADRQALDEKNTIEQVETRNSTIGDDDLRKNAKLVETQDSRFAAVNARTRPSPLSKSLLRLYPILFVAFMNSAANGFDGNTFGGVSSVPDFQARFGTNVAASNGFLAAIVRTPGNIHSFPSPLPFKHVSDVHGV